MNVSYYIIHIAIRLIHSLKEPFPLPRIAMQYATINSMENAHKYPICVDLDGTLVHSDTLLEVLVKLVKEKPNLIPKLLRWWWRGKAPFKHQVNQLVTINPSLLPYNKELLEWLRQERQKGRKLYLATASHKVMADHVANHLGIFDGTFATDSEKNLSGPDKAKALTDAFGKKQFIYAGNSRVDVPVWKQSAGAIIVQARPGVVAQAEKAAPIVKTFPDVRGLVAYMIARSARLHQWIKNILIFVPLLTAHLLAQPDLVLRAVIAFLAFSFTASSIYMMNDLTDLEADRTHELKRHRPLAAGKLSIAAAAAGIAILLALSVGLSLLFLPRSFLAILSVYIISNLAYSLHLKRIVLIDVLVLTFLYVLRLQAGSIATGVPISGWLLAFAAFVFTSLALVKRGAEVANLKKQNKSRTTGRGYHQNDFKFIIALGLLCGYLSLLVLGLYIDSPAVAQLYNTPLWLWLLIPLFFLWFTRIWYLTYQGRVHEDPVVFAIKDIASYVVGAITIILILVAT